MKVKAKDEHFCPHCGADLWEVGVLTHSRAHQTANFIGDGEICDFDDTVIDEPDHVQCEACGGDLDLVEEPIRERWPSRRPRNKPIPAGLADEAQYSLFID